MKVAMVNKSFRAEQMMALMLFFGASLMPGSKVSAQPLRQDLPRAIRFGEGTTCYINGADYPVDDIAQIWAMGNAGRWVVIGHIVYGPYGPVAVRDDGFDYPAVCR